MAEGAISVYTVFKEQLLKSAILDLSSAGTTVKITLHTGETFSAADTWSTVSGTEYTTAGNYTADTKALANKAVTADGANVNFDADTVTWTALTLSPTTPACAILRVDDANDYLICFVELGTTATNGGDYSIVWDTSPNAILQLA